MKLKKLLSVLLLLALLAGLAPAALTAYAEGETAKVKGLSFTGKGYTEKEGVYSPDFKEKKASFKGQAAPEKAYELQVSSFFTDSKCKKPLKTEPAEGETYYFRVGLKTEKGYSLDLSGVKAKTCSVKLEGFELKYKKLQRTQDGVSLLYAARLLPPEDAEAEEDSSSPAAPQNDSVNEAPQNDGETEPAAAPEGAGAGDSSSPEAPQNDNENEAPQNDGKAEEALNDEGNIAPQEEPAGDEPKEVTHYKVWIGDTEITSENLDGEGWSFDPASSTLTLNNPAISGNHPTTWAYSALICSEIDLVVTGKASITANGSGEMVIFCDKSLTFRNCDLALTSGNRKGVFTHRGDISVESGTLKATGKEGGIFSFENISISGGTVIGKGEEGSGIKAQDGTLSISGGTVEGTGSDGIESTFSTLSITGGSVKAVGTDYHGLYGKEITVGNGVTRLEAQGVVKENNGYYGALEAKTNITIGDRLAFAEPEGGSVDNDSQAKCIRDDKGKAAEHVVLEPRYLITFKDWDGTTLQSGLVAKGKAPSYTGEAPVRDEDTQYTYSFKGWKDEDGTEYAANAALPNASKDVIYTAVYTQTSKAYSVTFKNGDEVLQSSLVAVGQSPSYTGETPAKDSTAQYDYTFKGWKDEDGKEYGKDETLPAVKGEVTYTAVYTETLRQYTVTFLDEGGAVLLSGLVDYGQAPSYTGETPAKDSTAQYDYTFKGWKDEDGKEYGKDESLPAVKGEVTYTAVYTETLRQYTVTFLDEGGAELLSGLVNYGQAPSYTGETPTKEMDADYTYTFKGWKDDGGSEYAADDTLPAVEGDATYTAVYEATPRIYSVTVKDDGHGSGEATPTEGPRGTRVTLKATPRKGYEFKEWKVISGGVSVSGNSFEIGGEDVVVKAVFQAVSYKVTDGGGTIWTKGSNKNVSVTVKRSPDDSSCFSHFTGVQIDGKDLAAGDYEAKAGSTVVTLKAVTLEKLSSGRHTITLVFDDGSVNTRIIVKVGSGSGNGSAVRTGDVSIGIWFALLGGSILGLCGVAAAAVVWRRRRSNEAK